MSEKNKKVYWVEGVTRDEVIRSLTDHRPTRLRDQIFRRWLVVIYGLLLAVMAGLVLITGVKLRTYLQPLIYFGLIYLYLTLRRAVRHISDAPNELLDERQIAIRNGAYLIAYRYLGGLTILFYLFGQLVGQLVGQLGMAGGSAPLQGSWFESAFFYIGSSWLMLAAGLPAMVLAWTLPSEGEEVE